MVSGDKKLSTAQAYAQLLYLSAEDAVAMLCLVGGRGEVMHEMRETQWVHSANEQAGGVMRALVEQGKPFVGVSTTCGGCGAAVSVCVHV